MLKKMFGKQTLLCFSPPIMILSFVIEICLGIYITLRYRPSAIVKISTILLMALAIFQLAEYFVCGGLGTSAEVWSRIGYISITTLPPLGLHLLYTINRRKPDALVATAYASAVGFISFFLFYAGALVGHQCTGNYVIFQTAPALTYWYSLYYGGWLLIALILGGLWLRNDKQMTERVRRSTKALMAGYLVFLVPTAVVYSVKPETVSGIPSIMCGFAVTLAIILALYIVPIMANEKFNRLTRALKGN